MNANTPAYPHEEQDSCGNPMTRHAGLTKRELIAAMVLSGIAADPNCTTAKICAKNAVEWTDCLLAELAKPAEATP